MVSMSKNFIIASNGEQTLIELSESVNYYTCRSAGEKKTLIKSKELIKRCRKDIFIIIYSNFNYLVETWLVITKRDISYL